MYNTTSIDYPPTGYDKTLYAPDDPSKILEILFMLRRICVFAKVVKKGYLPPFRKVLEKPRPIGDRYSIFINFS